jgi:hypothetical protein
MTNIERELLRVTAESLIALMHKNAESYTDRCMVTALALPRFTESLLAFGRECRAAAIPANENPGGMED